MFGLLVVFGFVLYVWSISCVWICIVCLVYQLCLDLYCMFGLLVVFGFVLYVWSISCVWICIVCLVC